MSDIDSDYSSSLLFVPITPTSEPRSTTPDAYPATPIAASLKTSWFPGTFDGSEAADSDSSSKPDHSSDIESAKEKLSICIWFTDMHGCRHKVSIPGVVVFLCIFLALGKAAAISLSLFSGHRGSAGNTSAKSMSEPSIQTFYTLSINVYQKVLQHMNPKLAKAKLHPVSPFCNADHFWYSNSLELGTIGLILICILLLMGYIRASQTFRAMNYEGSILVGTIMLLLAVHYLSIATWFVNSAVKEMCNSGTPSGY